MKVQALLNSVFIRALVMTANTPTTHRLPLWMTGNVGAIQLGGGGWGWVGAGEHHHKDGGVKSSQVRLLSQQYPTLLNFN